MANNENDELKEMFGEPISVYTDANACEDGVLVSISQKDRVTRNVWEWLAENTPMTSRPPNNWPVEMMGWFRAGSITQKDAMKMIAKYGLDAQSKYEKQIRDKKAAALSIGLIGRDAKMAKRVYDENIGGGIHKVFAHVENGTITEITEKESAGTGDVTLWMLPNENGGTTLMFPEDY